MSQSHIDINSDKAHLHSRVDPMMDDNVSLLRTLNVEVEMMTQLHHEPQAGVFTENATVSRHILHLPSEIMKMIISFLKPLDLVSISRCCRRLAVEARSDILWQHHVQDNVPGSQLTSAFPYDNFRELYRALDPLWFIPKYKLWFGNQLIAGQIILARFNPAVVSITGYRLMAKRLPSTIEHWEADVGVLIHNFLPRCRLDLENPVLVLDALWNEMSDGFPQITQMLLDSSPRTRTKELHEFLLASPTASQDLDVDHVWPPVSIPARHRVKCAPHFAYQLIRRAELSTQTFRIRHHRVTRPGHIEYFYDSTSQIVTYSTLDPRFYTPTKEKPYRGIWVGDYGVHGCEFLLMHQPDDMKPFDNSSVVRGLNESEDEFLTRMKEERIYRGSIQAIKLTGDPNIPRGEVSFICDDISENGLVARATDTKFHGARIVRSRGHIAASMFQDDQFIEGQLILISHNRLAFYWVSLGHINYYERVDIDFLLAV